MQKKIILPLPVLNLSLPVRYLPHCLGPYRQTDTHTFPPSSPSDIISSSSLPSFVYLPLLQCNEFLFISIAQFPWLVGSRDVFPSPDAQSMRDCEPPGSLCPHHPRRRCVTCVMINWNFSGTSPFLSWGGGCWSVALLGQAGASYTSRVQYCMKKTVFSRPGLVFCPSRHSTLKVMLPSLSSCISICSGFRLEMSDIYSDIPTFHELFALLCQLE